MTAWIRRATTLLAFAAGAVLVPGPWLARDADALFSGDAGAQRAHARAADTWIADATLDADALRTGSARFDGEWLFGTFVMSALGHGHIALEHPELAAEHAAQMDACIAAAVEPRSRAFDLDAWGTDPLDDLGTDRAHAAWLGYLDVALGLHRAVDPSSRWAGLHDRVTAHLAERLDESAIGLVETYPGETYPVDNAAIVGALGLHQRTTGEDHRARIARFREVVGARHRDERSGLLVQAVRPWDGAPVDDARGSGTLLASYFLGFADAELSRSLWLAARAHLYREAAGFGAMRERVGGDPFAGDIDSGPVVLGLSTSASGFALGASRVHGDEDAYAALYATTSGFGAPRDDGDARRFALGAPIGDAILFAMLTAPRIDAEVRR